MQKDGKSNILGVLIDAVDYQGAVDRIIAAAKEKRPLSVSALAVHGLMTGVLDGEQKFRLNHLDLLVPDGQPVRWALNLLHDCGLTDRVYGPNLTLRVCARAAEEGLPVFLYGSTVEVLVELKRSLRARFPRLVLAGTEASRFRQLTPEERSELAARIRASGAAMVFVGLGCPRQETFAYECRALLGMPILAVGAAFPFIAGIMDQAPGWMQRVGLEWLFRLQSEPQRLWKRYLLLNPAYLFLISVQALRIARFSAVGRQPSRELLYG
jgi:N-acetylglucosaminyldiphosphoundecaprenol N-acetyl-beta-D-mannosaminyltransferase